MAARSRKTTTKLIPAQRREELVNQLRARNVLSIAEAASMLRVSSMTVRRDIEVLREEGRARPVPGGVMLSEYIRREPSFRVKVGRDTAEKRAIAMLAGTLIHDDMVLYLDAGTTTGALIPTICEHHNLTVITTDLTISARLVGAAGIDVVQVGGKLDPVSRSAVGKVAEDTLARLNTDMSIISASSWDAIRGVTTPSEPKIGLKQAAVSSAVTSILLATSSKYGSFSLYDVAPLSQFDQIFTDWRISEHATRQVADAGGHLEIAPESPSEREADA
jgi:DeoR/GlpR family transcriptional regulator of sugar metabolism